MASIDDDSPPDLIKKKVVVLREGIVPQNKETNAVFMPSPGKLQEIKQDPRLCKEISFTKSMTSEDIKEVLKNAFPILADTERFFCAKRVQKENQLDFCGERGIWDGQVLNREIRGKSLLYIYCEEKNSDQDPSLTAQMEKMQISRNESSSEDRSDSSFETYDIPEGERLFSNYGAKTSLENQVKQLRDDVNDKLEYVGASLVSIASVLREEKKLDQQLIEGETKLTEDTSSERLGERLFSNYGAKTSLENQVKQLHDDVNDKLEYVRAALVSIASVVRDEKKPDQQLIEGETKLTEDTSSERLEKSLSRSKIGEVKDSTSLEKVTSVLKDKQQTEEQRGEDESESFEETLSENQATSPSTINKGKDSTSPEELVSVPVDKQQTEEQSGEDESEPFKETLSVGPATSPSTIDKGKDSISPEEVISVQVVKQQTEEQSGEDESEPFKETLSVGPETSLSRLKIGEVKDPTSLEEVTSVPKDKQQTEEQRGEDESESFEETLGENQATSPSTIDEGKDSASLEEVISVPMDKKQTEEQSGEDESESFKITLGVGPVAQDHDIKGKTTTFEAEHKECIRVLPYTDASGQDYVQLYVFCAKNDIPKDLKEDAQELFGETGVELRWTNLYNYASNVPSIVSKEFEQLEVSQVNDIAKIIDKNLSVFSKHRNITAIHPSLKVTNSKQTNSPCIRVYVLGKGCIPVDESEIPEVVEDCLVDIVDGFWCETLDTFKPLTAHKQEKYLRLGASIGVKETNDAGTLGAIVTDNKGRFYLLSVNHVINQEQSREIIHPGLLHYLASLKYHLIDYHNWINRIFKLEHIFRHDHPNLEIYFSELKNQVDLLLTSDGDRHPKLTECEEQLGNLFSKPPRTVAYFKDHVSQVSTSPNNLRIYVDAAVAELTCEEKDALIENGYVEIIDTGDYPNGCFSNDAADNYEREWRKSGSSTGYTSLKSFLTFKVFLRISEHEIVPCSALDNVMWRPNVILLLNNGNLFSYWGDSGAVIFEKTDPQLQAMIGFGIITGGLFSNHVCVGTLAVPLCEALGLLSDKLDSELALVSAM